MGATVQNDEPGLQNDLGGDRLEQEASWKSRRTGTTCEQGPELRIVWGMDRQVQTRKRQTARWRERGEGREGETDNEGRMDRTGY